MNGFLTLSSLSHTFFQRANDSCTEKRKTMTERFLMDGVTNNNNNQRLKSEVTTSKMKQIK